ncbi:hypothetical protein D0Y65_052877 [Glycine soja]|uniref:ATP-dependent DNA helicase n=1 Tax=Glycine soja TaxID=3848 RepID=A0A445EZT1_GLYSO|nr:hypothetical protein D0Y65_052877 [Glycine soja]
MYNNKDVLNEDIIIAMKNMLDNNNHYAHKFRMARDKLQSLIVSDLKLKLIYDRQSDGRLYNLPNTAEVVALIVGDEHTVWPEIQRKVRKSNLTPHDCPGVVLRIFKMKLNQLMNDLKRGHVFGPILGFIYTIEWQKRGLPHAHILIFLQPANKYPNPEDIDKIISAEIPNKYTDPELYQIISKHMIHGPCGLPNRSAPCMADGKCIRFFPKKFNEATIVDRDGFPVYRRTNDGRTVQKHGIELDNRFVVPYSPQLLLKYRTHLNVEWCNQSTSIKNLFKYINKGSDRITTSIVNVQNQNGRQHQVDDEIKQYLDCREACFAKGFLGSDQEFLGALREANTWGTPHFLRKLFVNLLFMNTMERPEYVWQQTWRWMTDDIVFNHKSQGYAANPHQNKLIYNEMAYDKEVLATEFNRCYHSMTDKKASIFDNIMCVVASQLGGVYFLYGYGGTGKTFMWKTLSSAVRSNGGIVLTVASSDIASLLLPGGRTTHSKFAIPVLATQNSTCNIHQESNLAELLQRTKLIIWDEAPMCHKFSFEALDKSLKDIMYNDRPFGGKFSDWLLDIGDGKVGQANNGHCEITIPYEFLIMDFEDPIQAIVDATYPYLLQNYNNADFLQKRAILASTKDVVDKINDYVLSLIPSDEKKYCSADSVDKSDELLNPTFGVLTPEFLNTLKTSGIPNHKLRIKIGTPIILLRNLDQANGLCNGTRLIVTKLGTNVVEAEEYEPGRRYRQNTSSFSSRLFLFSVSASSSRLCLSLQPYHHCALAILKNNSNLQHSEIKEIVAGSASEGFSIPACVTTTGTSLIIRQMTTPPSSPPPPPSDAASHSPFTLKRTRKATYLRSLATRVVGVERPLVHVDPETENVDGPHRKKLRTYLGIVARDNVDVTYENLKQVPTAQKDLIWEDIQMQSEGLALPPKPEVGPSAARVNTKESYVDPSRNDPYMSDLEKCGLAVGLTKPIDRPDHDADDPLYLMTLTIPQLFLKSLQVMWDTTMFVVFNDNFPLYIKHEDMSEITHGGQCLSISVIQLWILHMTEISLRAGNANVYGFLEPRSIQRSVQSQFESESYIKNWMQNSKRGVYLGAYLNGALKEFDDTPQSKSKVAARWIAVRYFNDAKPLKLERLKALLTTDTSPAHVDSTSTNPFCFVTIRRPNGCPVQAYSEKFSSTIPGEFEDLANWIIGLPPPFLLSCFISVLAPEIRSEPPLVIKRLTSDEIASHHEHDLCLNCDERYHRGHHYASRVFLFITEDEDTSGPNIESADSSTDPPKPPDPHPAQISLNSLTGHLAPEALRLVGLIIDHSVVLLLDGGSTHNFAQHQLVAQLGLPCRATSPLRVMVGNDQNLECTTISFNKFFSIVPLYGTIMATYKLQSIAFALCSTAKPSAIC